MLLSGFEMFIEMETLPEPGDLARKQPVILLVSI